MHVLNFFSCNMYISSDLNTETFFFNDKLRIRIINMNFWCVCYKLSFKENSDRDESKIALDE